MSPIEVVASGLVNPRGLAFSADGRLHVAKAGLGNQDGAVTRIDLKKGTQERLIEGLPSSGNPEGEVCRTA